MFSTSMYELKAFTVFLMVVYFYLGKFVTTFYFSFVTDIAPPGVPILDTDRSTKTVVVIEMPVPESKYVR